MEKETNTKVKINMCNKCKHRWINKMLLADVNGEDVIFSKPPAICPKCKSGYWNTPTEK